MGQDRLKDQEPRDLQEGIRIKFTNSELLRAYILGLQGSPAATLAERMAGIRERSLGKLALDGGLFESVEFRLVVEPDKDQRGERPTCVIRADLYLGEKGSSLIRFQSSRANGEEVEQEEHPFSRMFKAFERTSSLPDEEYDLGILWSRNTMRFSNPSLDKNNYYKKPLTLLQLWDKDVGEGSISISLMSLGRYYDMWNLRYAFFETNHEFGLEVDMDEVDCWQFNQFPVGVDVYDAESFIEAINYYEEAFSKTLRLLYLAENMHAPSIVQEIEPPSVLKEEARITFSDIGGQKDAVKVLKASALSEKMGQAVGDMRKGKLLYGPPGNGKSSLARALSSELGVPVIIKTTKDLPNGANDTVIRNFLEAAFMEAKSVARRSGSKVVFCLEALEAFLGSDLRLHDFFLNSLEEWARDEEVVFVATSNFPENLHPGIISRFEAIAVPQLNREGRGETLKITARKITKLAGNLNVFGEVDFEKIADRLQNQSGRDILTFLGSAYDLVNLRNRENGRWEPIDTQFLLDLIPLIFPQRRALGFKSENS